MKQIIPQILIISSIFGIVLINSCKKDPVIPTLTTNSIINITINSVTSGGSITKDGGAAVSSRGVCWSTSADPTVSGSYTTDDKGIGSFVSNITGLTPNTLYHIRAYATNKAGTAYGNDVSFTTTPILVPTLTTTAVTAITLTSAVSGGTISSDGNADITAKGVCWATTAAPTIANFLTTDGTGSGSFTSNLSGLLPGTIYYLRAYATNSAGTSYGNEVTFTTNSIVVPTLTTTAATLITLTTAVSGGNITADGGGAISVRGVCWATTANPTTTNSKTTDGTGIGSFISNLTGLVAGTTYHVRAYATNSAGTAYGNEITFNTSAIAVPTLTTTAVTSITLTSGVSGGNITTDGGGAVTIRGVCWATTASPTTSSSKTSDGTGSGSFTSNLSGLLPATTYYVRAYATNSAGTSYGNEVSFTTGQIVVATLTTTTVSSITLTTAVSGGNITANGGGTITARGVCWATTTTPTISNFITTDGTGSGIFTSNLTGLLPGTTYHLRTYATNSAGTAYGNELLFTTNPIVLPTLTTAVVTSITQTTAVSGGNITVDGGGTITARGTCWAATANPTISDSKTTNGTGTGIFSSNLTGLTPGTTYHVRAYATNSAGTSYGNEVSFTTAATIATLTTAAATSITMTTAISGGNITADGGGAITARGACWATTSNPTVINNITTNGTGTGIFTSNLSGLLAGTTYHIRAYATNSAGTAYGNDVSFTTSPALLPTLTTTAVSSIALTTAVSGGNITADGGGSITARGACWSTTANPTITDNITSNGTGTGSFTSNLTGLLPGGTTYYVRAYATNSTGTAYGNQLIFTTRLADVDGNNYSTVTIGAQVWMAENLKTTSYNTNTPIPYVTDNTAWTTITTPDYSWYDNDMTTYKSLFGALYNWYTVNTGILCPTGWHVPSDAEFNTLEIYLGMSPDSTNKWYWRGTIPPGTGNQMKNTTGWAVGENGTNTSGFSALPGGYRSGATGSFNANGILTYWWTSTEEDVANARYRRLDGNNIGVFRSVVVKQGGKYVRCLKN
jgi:uncharacterized protein (TIGR02145 family)